MGLTFDASTEQRLLAWCADLTDIHELEAVVRKKISRPQFREALHKLAQNGYKTVQHPEQLDISTPDHFRTTLQGTADIAQYYNTDQVPQACTVIQKRRADESINVEEYGPCRFNLKSEVPMDDPNERMHFMQGLRAASKTFRLKKRISLTHDSLPMVRIDMTMVRAAILNGNDDKKKSQRRTFKQSGIMNAPPTYEMEVELLAKDLLTKDTAEPAEAVEQLRRALEDVLLALNDGFPLITLSEQTRVLKDYMALVHPDVALDKVHVGGDLRRFFAGPYPVTLEMVNMLPPGTSTSPSIFKGYSVTDKADGERCLCFVSSEPSQRAYLIDNRLNVKALDFVVGSPNAKPSLLDGEYIIIDGGTRALFAVFDTYVSGGNDVRGMPLQTRLQMAQGVIDTLVEGKEQTETMRKTDIKVKTFVFGDENEMAKGCAQILRGSRAGNLPYKMDGLIFTPRDVPVGADSVSSSPKWGMRWPLVLKWKPLEDNSIDFLIKFPKDGTPPIEHVVISKGRPFRVANLYVGFNPDTDQAVRAIDYLVGKGVSSSGSSSSGSKYIAKMFDPDGTGRVGTAYIPLAESTTAAMIRCLNGDEIADGSIVEFSYDGKPGEDPFSPYLWRPLRIRADKTEELVVSGRISANNYKTAVNVWNSITSPITEDMVTGAGGLRTLEKKKEGVYYDGAADRTRSAMLSMRDFHNWVKEGILHKYGHSKRSLLDLACGMGGDIRKWMGCGFMDVVGLDLFESNISDPERGAYARLQRIKLPREARYVFLPYDVSKSIDATNMNRVVDPSDRMIMQALWGLVPRQAVKPPGLVKYYALARGGFDVVSCQFAVHYFFKSDETLSTFVTNVVHNLKPGGVFIGTCMDGLKVRQLLQKVKKGESATALTADGRVIWSIKKLYEDDENKAAPTQRQTSWGTGQVIQVYLESIDNAMEEYLVDFAHLTAVMKSGGLSLKGTGLFGDNDITDVIGLHDGPGRDAGKSVKSMTDKEREFSFLNRWFAFSRPASSRT